VFVFLKRLSLDFRELMEMNGFFLTISEISELIPFVQVEIIEVSSVGTVSSNYLLSSDVPPPPTPFLNKGY